MSFLRSIIADARPRKGTHAHWQGLPTAAELRFVAGCGEAPAEHTVPCRATGSIERCRVYPTGAVYRDPTGAGGFYRRYYCVVPTRSARQGC